MDKVKEMYPRSKFYHLKVGNLQEIKKALIYPQDRYLKSKPKCLHKSPYSFQILTRKKRIELYIVPLAYDMFFLYIELTPTFMAGSHNLIP